MTMKTKRNNGQPQGVAPTQWANTQVRPYIKPWAAPAVILLGARPAGRSSPFSEGRTHRFAPPQWVTTGGYPYIVFCVLFFFISITHFYGCATQPSPKYTKEGKVYGVTKGLFRNRWWNFYERGISFAEGEFYEEAITDFKEAIRMRDQDQRRARSYGMRFLDYFPHRGMGIALYQLKKYPEAIRELEISLSQEESAKAKYFLNKAREALFIAHGEEKLPPRIQITTPLEGEYTNLFSIEVSGIAEDDQFVSRIEINDKPLFIELAQKTIEFKQAVELHDGINLISVKAKDLTGGKSEKAVRVIVDRQGPLFSVEKVNHEQIKDGIVVIQCSVADEAGLSSLNFYGKTRELGGKKEAEIDEKVILKAGEGCIPFEVKDLAGNVTAGEINLSSPQVSNVNPVIQVAFLDKRLRDLGAGLFSKDKEAPPVTIHLKDLAERQTVHYETILIDGNASGPYEIKSIAINGTYLFVKPARNLFFNHLAQLREGENRFEIKVTDKEGNTAMKNIIVIRETPRVKRVNSRMSILLLPFETKGQAPSAGDVVFDALTSAFVNQGRFNVVSREKMEEVLKELKLSRTDLVDPSKALKGGRMIAAEGIIMGTINETPNSIEIFARLINSETTSVLAAKDVFSQDKSITQIQFLSEGLALKFKHSFPLVEGQVVKVKGNEVYTDSGLNKNIKKEMKFIVYREGEKIFHPVTGKFLGCESIDLGELRVEEVFDDFSKGRVLAKKSVAIQVKDKVITK